MEMSFKQSYDEGLFTYLFVARKEGGLQSDEYNKSLHNYLSFAKSIAAGLSCFVLTRYSPFLRETIPESADTDWHYNVLSDDLQGLGTDLEFSLFHRLRNGNSVREMSAYFPLKDLLTLRSFPEDTFGDKSSHLTIFALKPGSEEEIKSFLETRQIPILAELLMDKELFIHIECAKSTGYYDTVLIKSVQSLTEKIKVTES